LWDPGDKSTLAGRLEVADDCPLARVETRGAGAILPTVLQGRAQLHCTRIHSETDMHATVVIQTIPSVSSGNSGRQRFSIVFAFAARCCPLHKQQRAGAICE
jgi:hypothetical protein